MNLPALTGEELEIVINIRSVTHLPAPKRFSEGYFAVILVAVGTGLHKLPVAYAASIVRNGVLIPISLWLSNNRY